MMAPSQPRPHRESLLNIPLVRHLFADRAVTLRARRIDQSWYANGLTPSSAVGFRPFYGELFYASHGPVAKWLKNPHGSPRRLNRRDFLAHDVLFLLHDYLHAWSYSFLRSKLGLGDLGFEPITERRIERYAFLHLLSETCATVGLDYWWLSAIELDDVVPIGTRRSSLAVGYHDRHLREYRRACPDLAVHRPEFFSEKAEFYCTGDFYGFDARDLRMSPVLDHWIRHELEYGRIQRAYTRQWLRHLGGLEPLGFKEASAPLRCDQKWQRKVASELGEALWDKVKNDVLHELLPREDGPWASPARKRIDFRFTDVTTLTQEEIEHAAEFSISSAEFRAFFSQYVSMFRYESMSPRWRSELLPLVQASNSIRATLAVMEGARPLPPCEGPRDVFFLG